MHPAALPVAIGYLTPWDGENQLHLIGEIDEVAIFNKAVSAAEAAQFYNDGHPTGHCTSANYAPVFISTPGVIISRRSALFLYAYRWMI